MHAIRNKLSRTASSPNFVLFIVCIGIFVAALDQTVVYGAIAEMMFDLRLNITDLDQVSWLVVGYFLGYTFALPLVGRISDAYGHRRVYAAAMCVFMGGSILIALVDSFDVILAGRIIQAIGGGAVVPAGMAIIADTYPIKRRAIALGFIGAAIELGAALGPLYGSVFAEYLSWRWIFWINIPVAIIVIGLVYLLVKPSAPIRGTIDYRGGALFGVSLALLSLGLSQQMHRHNAELYMAASLAGSVLLFSLFIRHMIKAQAPLVRLSMFRHRTFSAANTAHLFVGGALIIAIVVVPLMAYTLMEVQGVAMGLRLLRLTLAIPIGAVAGGFLCYRLGYRIPTILGLITTSAGLFLLSRWTTEIAEPWLTVHLAMSGLGFGLVIAPITTAVLNSVSTAERGIASALVTATRMIGMVIGLSIAISLGMDDFHVLAGELSIEQIEEELPSFGLSMFQSFFFAAAVVCLAAIVPALWMKLEKARERHLTFF